jgi:hypothetical protein
LGKRRRFTPADPNPDSLRVEDRRGNAVDGTAVLSNLSRVRRENKSDTRFS